MGLMFQIHDAKQLDEGVWKVRLSSTEVRLLDAKPETTGSVSILLLTDIPVFDRDRRSLSFNPMTAKLLTAGSTETAIVIGVPVPEPRRASAAKSITSMSNSGDTNFLLALSSELKDFGTQLLREVRKYSPGDLRFFPKSGKFVETPDNFWTVRPQSRDGSFRITVRGRPESFEKPKSLDLKPDMTGYSSVKVSRPSQIEELVRLLRQVRRK
jgi:hypothetical protein